MILKGEKGFTLLEIMVVVIIIGLLATMVAINVVAKKCDAERRIAMVDIRALEDSLELYKLDNHSYPDMEQGIKALIETPSTGQIPCCWNGPYLKKRDVPKDPWSRPYLYRYPGSQSDYDIITLGEDGVTGGAKCDADITNFTIEEESR
ncbi:MAG TPA: type II secretion system major pseudopilin GspG [bacterium]